jgi:plastocyanin
VIGRVAIAATALGLTLVPAACAPDDPLIAVPETPDDAIDLSDRSEVTVRVTDNRFTDRTIMVDPGTTVTWINEGLNSHNVKPSIPGAFAAIATKTLDNGGSGSVLFRTVGDYPYYCSIHGSPSRGQTGRVIVVPG